MTPPPPRARLPDGQSCCWLFGLLLLDAPLPEIICSPDAPAGPCGPAGPAGICPGAKSAARSEAFFTFAELTELFFSCAVPTLLRGSAVDTAYAAPLSEIARARQATTRAGDGGRRRTAGRSLEIASEASSSRCFEVSMRVDDAFERVRTVDQPQDLRWPIAVVSRRLPESKADSLGSAR